MLNRAVNKARVEPPKNDLAKQLFPSSSPHQDGNIGDMLMKPRTSSQSIGGFIGVTNSSQPLRPRSTNTMVKTTSKIKANVSPAGPASGLGSVLSRQDSFQEPTTNPTRGTMTGAQPFEAVEFNEDDFDFDDTLDLDIDYPLPSASMAAPPKPSQPLQSAPSPYQLPQMPRSMVKSANFQNPSSSAQTWSSSSPSHKRTPPAARLRKEIEATADLEIIEQPIFKPAPSKRRTLPWAEKKARDDEITSSVEEDEVAAVSVPVPAGAFCYKCKKKGSHYPKDCPTGKSLASDFAFTPLPKDKNMPWNTTASAIKEEKKLFKGRQKRKVDEAQLDAAGNQQKKQATKMAPITLSDEQKLVQNLVCNDAKSVFFTGSAGTGKSVLMRSIIQQLRSKYAREPDRVAVTASTGLAACNIGGVTLHSFGGIGLGKEDVPTLVKKIKRNQKAKNRWIRTKILVIDEISMVDGDLFDKLEGIARSIRNNGRPFGGIQLVITGDFFQLPPVPDQNAKTRGVKFAFDAGTWGTAIHHTIGLTEVFRQKDPVFASMLNEMRLGKVTDATITAFKNLTRKITYEDAIDATELFPTRNEVDNSNAFRLRSLVGKSYKYLAKDTGTIIDEVQRDRLLANMMAPKSMELKKGAQVMLIKNMDETLVNGSLGKVVAFMSEKSFEIYDKNPDIFEDTELPDEDDDHERQQALQKFKLLNQGNHDLIPLLPLVRFAISDGTHREILIQPEEWKVELPNGEVQAQRSQLPLILAWALSIHKAQGQTLERVKIDLKKVFETGQAYVALSRATSQAGLEVQNFDPKKVMAHPRVAEFYNSLYSVNSALKHPKVSKPAP